jgi:serine/threonine protein kinase/Flp pilus assembly protein TadD
VNTPSVPPASSAATVGAAHLSGGDPPEPGTPASTILLGSPGTPGGARAAPAVATTSGGTKFGDTRLFGQGPLAVGQPFGPRYQILRVLGVGGMGAVYQAWDAALGVAVALKVIRTDHRQVTAEIEERFKNELLLARQVTHKSVVRIHDLGEIDGIKYITMPYVDGQDLATLLRKKGKLPVETTLRIARQMADGLQAAHEAGVLHRDLKPANVMLSTGDEIHAYIMDFGISTSTEHAEGGPVMGTLEYMPPEQALGGPIDARADIYTFGLIVHELLTGLRPIPGSTQAERIEAMKKRFLEGLPPLRSLDPSIPEPVEEIVTRCLASDPADRFQTTSELCAGLARLDDSGEVIPEPRRLTKPMLAFAIALMVLLAAGTYFATRSLFAPEVEQPPVSVLVADIENRTGDSTFDGTIEQSLMSGLERATFVTLYPRKSAVELAQKLKPGSRIDAEMARLISNSEGIGVIVDGRVERQGNGYLVSVRATNAADGKVVAEERERASDKSQVLAAVGTLADDVRRALGDTMPEGSAAAAETFTATSLDAMAAYARGQELNYAGRQTDALKAFQEAVTLDPGLARAYSGMGVIYGALKQDAKAEESYQNALKNLHRMTEREKFRTLGGYYLLVTHNYESAIDNYRALVDKYPADDTGHANLAYAYLNVRNVPKAVEEGRKAIEIYPKNTLQRTNYAMYSMFAGDFKTAIEESNKVLEANPSYEYALLTVANSQVGAGELDAARQTWERLRASSALGASMASLGRADLEMYLGRPREAVAILGKGSKTDETAGSPGEAAAKYVALAEALYAVGTRPAAAAAARKAASLRPHESVLFPAAMVLTDTGDVRAAKELATQLNNMLQSQTSSYAHLITGHIAFREKRLGDALEAFREAQKKHDSWFAHLMLGRAYLEAGRFAEAVAEFEACVKRKGEASDVFFENISTIRYLPPVYFWLGRAQHGLGAGAAARDSYEQFLKLRSEAAPADPLAAEARQQIKKL